MLDYEILAEVVTEKDESSIYDMFARLNSNNYVLNRQEIRNSKYWGDFKVFIYRLPITSMRPMFSFYIMFFKSGLFLFGEKFLPIQSFLPCLNIFPVIRVKHSALTLGFAS